MVRLFDDGYPKMIDERCPDCQAALIKDALGNRWCSLIGCEWSEEASSHE